MTPEGRSIELTRGSDWSETWRFLDRADAAVSLTGITGELLVRPAAGSAVVATGTFTPTGTTGEATVALTAEEIALLDDVRVAHWTLTLTDTGGEEHVARGTAWLTDEP